VKMAQVIISDADDPESIPLVTGKEGTVDFFAMIPIDLSKTLGENLLGYGKNGEAQDVSPETKESIRRVRRVLADILKGY
jgi:hypothetical protein